jgi:Zn-dependent protease
LPPVDLSQLPIAILVLVASLTVHEAAHAWCADLLGDPTPAAERRVSLSPATHFDLVGMVLFPVAAKIAGLGFAGWSRPVRLTTEEMGRHWRRNTLLVWMAGPISHLVMAVLAAMVFRFGGALLDGAIAILVWQAIQLNVLLAALNVIPVPPLDAGNALIDLVRPGALSTRRVRIAGPLILVALLVTGMLASLLSPLRSGLLALIL